MVKMQSQWYSSFAVRAGIILLVMAVRFVQFQGNPEGFAVIGSDFKTESSTSYSKSEQGYDGQFFFAYAHQPLSKQAEIAGIQIDHPGYRGQRFGYPLLVYVLSLGGNPSLVPWMMILVNIAAFLFLVKYWDNWVKKYSTSNLLNWIPIALSGLWMAVARDLAEVFEALFVLLAISALLADKPHRFIGFAVVGILFRETAFLILAPAAFLWYIAHRKSVKTTTGIATWVVPTVFLVALKAGLKSYYADFPQVDGSQNVGLPFKGMLHGFVANLPTDLTSWAEFTLWCLYFVFHVWLVVQVVKTISFKAIGSNLQQDWLGYAFVGWMCFAWCLGPAIYVDDWGFVRIFTTWSLVGFMYLVYRQKQVSYKLISFGLLLTASLIGRLIIRS